MSLTSALVGHLVGDYLLQNDWMAHNKKTSSSACLVHSFLWSASVCLFAGWGLWAFAILSASHFLLDRTEIVKWWMDFAGQQGFRTGPCSPWSSIVIDNVWHILTIWMVWKFIA